jgi:histidinol-phosphate aminotransferase
MPVYRAPAEGRLGKLRLDFNENTVGCAPAVQRAVARLSAQQLAMYPEYQVPTRLLANYFRVRPQELLLTNGADDALRVIFDAFVDPGNGVLLAEPTFGMYRFYATLAGARVYSIRYDSLMRLPLETILAAIRRRRPRVLFLANPNNPTGTLLDAAALRRIIESATRTLVVIDEAYNEFSGGSALRWINRYRNLVVVRTFSKAAGLAGLRLGCLLAHRDVLAALLRVASPYPVNTAVLAAAVAAVRDSGSIQKYSREITLARAQFEQDLARLGVRTFPSVANFLIADFGSRGTKVMRQLERQEILVRDRSEDFARPGFVRITIGTRAQMRRVLAAIRRALGRPLVMLARPAASLAEH